MGTDSLLPLLNCDSSAVAVRTARSPRGMPEPLARRIGPHVLCYHGEMVLAMMAESGRVVQRPRPLSLTYRLRVTGRWHVLFQCGTDGREERDDGVGLGGALVADHGDVAGSALDERLTGGVSVCDA